VRCRKNVKRLSADEKRLFVEAIRGLKAQDSVLHPGSQSRYDDFVEVHLDAMMAMVMDGFGNMIYPGWAHNDSAFLPWHRELLFRFEQELRAVKPETANVTIPYWDWTRAQASGDPGFPFTHNFIGVDGAGQPQDRVPQDPAVAGMVPYPHPFDPMAWTIVVTDGVEPAFLVRHFASTTFPFGIAPGDPRAPVEGAQTLSVSAFAREGVKGRPRPPESGR
jgi:Common central domain of tyrosinase